MDNNPRDKYEILDLIFTFLNTLCMVLTAFYLLNNLIISLMYSIAIVTFACVVLYLWIARNPFNIYLVRAFAFNNFFFTFIALILFYSRLSITLTEYFVGYVLLLFPSGIYLLISYKWSAVSILKDKRAGVMLAYTGRTKASRRLFFKDNKEDRIEREELIVKQKKEYNINLIIALTIALTLSSFAALIFGF